MRVKGKQEPVRIYEGLYRHAIGEQSAIEWQCAIDHYQEQNWVAARSGFESVIRQDCSGDSVAQLYLDRISAFEKEPPAKGWDGVWTMETK
jgi:hypothetical protein